jgi:hypothetical protein
VDLLTVNKLTTCVKKKIKSAKSNATQSMERNKKPSKDPRIPSLKKKEEDEMATETRRVMNQTRMERKLFS